MPGLGVTYTTLKAEVADYLGWSRTPANWSVSQVADLDAIIQAGLRQFYWPPPIPSGVEGKPPRMVRWSFLNISATVSLADGAAEYSLPSDFGGNASGFTFAAGDDAPPLTHIPEPHLRALQAANQQTGRPQYYAFSPAIANGSAAQGWKLIVCPTPSAAHTLSYRYDVSPQALSDANPYPYGPAAHAEAIVESCLAVAEERRNDQSSLHRERFQSLLLASIQYDATMVPAATSDTWGGTDLTSLDVNYDQLVARVGHELGYGWDPLLWNAAQRGAVEMAVQGGVRRFYSPPPIGRERFGHSWSFLCPLVSLTLEEGESTYDLPADFGGMDGPLSYGADENFLVGPVNVTSEHIVRHSLAEWPGLARPTLAAVLPKAVDNAAATAFQLVVWPAPDTEYTLSYRYHVNVAALTSVKKYPPGTQRHGETLLCACLSEAERMRDGKDGIHSRRYPELLAAAVSADRKASCPDNLGSSGNWDGSYDIRPIRRVDPVAYNGVVY